MTERCPSCDADLALVGRAHLCRPKPQPVAEPAPVERVIKRRRRPKKLHVPRMGSLKGTGGRPRKGREALTNKAVKPWLAEGVSERTWYRHRNKAKAEMGLA